MNPDLYTEEFRHFKYLKSDLDSREYYRKNYQELQLVQPWNQINDPDFVWETRLEFLEQLFDLKDETIYVVEPPVNKFSIYEDSRMYVISKPFVYKGKVFQVENEVFTEDIPDIEENPHDFYLSSKENSMIIKLFLRLSSTSLIPSDFTNYTAVFYDRDWAVKYKDAITYFLQKNEDAITAFTRNF